MFLAATLCFYSGFKCDVLTSGVGWAGCESDGENVRVGRRAEASRTAQRCESDGAKRRVGRRTQASRTAQ